MVQLNTKKRPKAEPAEVGAKTYMLAQATRHLGRGAYSVKFHAREMWLVAKYPLYKEIREEYA